MRRCGARAPARMVEVLRRRFPGSGVEAGRAAFRAAPRADRLDRLAGRDLVEQFADPRGVERIPAELQEAQAAPVGGDEPVLLEDEDSLARGADQLRLALEAQDTVSLEAALQQPMLDLLDGEADEPERMDMPHRGMAGHVEHAGEPAARIHDRRRGAGQDPVRLEEVFAAMHADRPPLDQRGADRIRADRILVPGHAGPKCHARCPSGELGIADHVEHEPVGVGQDHDTVGEARLGAERRHFRPRDAPQPLVLLVQVLQRGCAHRLDMRPRADIEALRRAAPP